MDKQTQKYLDNKFEGLKKNLDKRFEEHSKVIIEAVDYKFEKVHKELTEAKMNVNETYNLIDRHVKAQEDFKEEFTILKAEVAKIKEVIKDKLGVEIRAL